MGAKLRIEDFPLHMQLQIKKQLGIGRDILDPVQPGEVDEKPAKSKAPKGPNKTELAYKREVLDRDPTIKRVRFEPLTFRFENNHRYSPDWVYTLAGKLHCVEVKGSYKLGSYQRARLAFDQARVEFPEFTWIWAERQKDRSWKIDERKNNE